MAEQKTIYRVYHGSSMRAVFTPGDLLEVIPQPVSQITPGDVIVYVSDGGIEVAHRVVRKNETGWITRGDNNLQADPVPVTAAMLVGKVNQHIPVEKKRPLLMKVIARAKRKPKVHHVLRRVYRWLQYKQLVKKIWRPKITILSVQVDGCPVHKFLHQGKTVAIWDSRQQVFNCCHPYDLVIKNPEFAK